MNREYHRPKEIEEALALLAREEPVTVPLGGGTALNAPGHPPVAVVDLQDLGLDEVKTRGSTMTLGATVTLQTMLNTPGLHPALEQAVRLEATYNLRHAATVAGTLVTADGRSPFAAAMMALDASLTLLPGEESVTVGNILPLREEMLKGRLITKVKLPLKVKLAFHYVARSPADLPIVCVALAQWPSGRTRAVVGGFGDAPRLALDGPDAEGLETAVRSAAREAGDQWASAEYRLEAAATLAGRALQEVNVE